MKIKITIGLIIGILISMNMIEGVATTAESYYTIDEGIKVDIKPNEIQTYQEYQEKQKDIQRKKSNKEKMWEGNVNSAYPMPLDKISKNYCDTI